MPVSLWIITASKSHSVDDALQQGQPDCVIDCGQPPGEKISSKSFNLIGQDAFVFEHDGYVLLDAVNPILIFRHQSFFQRVVDCTAICMHHIARRDRLVNCRQLLLRKREDLLFGNRAAQNV